MLAARLDAPFLEVIGDVGCREPQPLGIDLTALKLVGGDVAEPLLQRLRLDGVDAALRRRLGAKSHGQGEDKAGDQEAPGIA